MKIILSQRIDLVSNYDDIPFTTYHFPRRYRNQIHSGDQFIYYQGNRYKKEQRYYFGCGIIGAVEPDITGDSYYAEILEGVRFPKPISIYSSSRNGFIENLGYEQVRKMPNPSWQNSIRKISDDAYYEILNLAKVKSNIGEFSSSIEIEAEALDVLRHLNKVYAGLQPKQKAKKIQNHLDRGSAVTKALKTILGATCQICGWIGFKKRGGEDFIEAHHISQLSEKKEGSLCTDNIILLCPNCHRELHYGMDFSVIEEAETIEIILSTSRAKIMKNTIEYLTKLNQ